MENYDVIILGGGPAGYVAAIKLAQLKKNVALVEVDNVGGVCLNWGCIPTKALLKSAEVYTMLSHAQDYGISAKKISINFDVMVKRSRKVASQLSDGIAQLVKKNKITLIEGRGELDGNNIVRITRSDKSKRQISGKNIIIATGARARTLPNLPIDGQFVVTSKEAMVLKELPKSILIVGSGAIGIEFASFFNALGSKVTVIDIADRILLSEDKEIAASAKKAFENRGMSFFTKTTIKLIKKGVNLVKVTLDVDGKEQIKEYSKIISAVGVVANIENIGLEATKVKTERGSILTDDGMQTHHKSIYAIGDVAGGPWLAHKASHEAIICSEHITGKATGHKLKKENIPGCIYSSPQIASVGLNEQQALDLGHEIKIGRFPFLANGKAVAIGKEKEGFIKTIFDKINSVS